MDRVFRRIAAPAAVGLLALAGCSYEIPELSAPIPEDAESSVALDADGDELFVFHGVENRDSVPLSQMPQVLQDAVLAIEDHRFHEHRGVDVRATMRALRANVEEGEVVEGGSTITQQYVKNALVGSDRTLDRKVREAAVAFQLEQKLSKDEILELYLNTIYFGAGAYGVQAAAQEFFGIDVADLDLAQSALLAGLIRAPSTYDPFREPELATERRDLVIGRMQELGWIDEATATAVTSAPIELRERTIEERYDAPYFVEEVRRFLLTDERFGETFEERRDLLFAGGLRIETSLDATLQAQAELAVRRVLPEPGSDPDVAVVVIDPSTGWVRAVVGGHDFFDPDADEAKLNLATQGRRPTGSAFKPIVLAAALEEGIRLEQTYSAPPLMEFDLPDGVWEVENYGGSGGGEVDLVGDHAWCRRDRGDHQLHQHQQPLGDGRRRTGRQEGRGKRPHGAATREDEPRPRLARGDRLPGEGRPRRRSRCDRFPDGRLWLHDLHRQQRSTAGTGGQRGGRR